MASKGVKSHYQPAAKLKFKKLGLELKILRLELKILILELKIVRLEPNI